MLKYRPKQFWGMLKRKATGPQPDPEAFAAFNEQLFHNPAVPHSPYQPLTEESAQWITTEELSLTLRDYFKADKSSGNSPLPL